jgi:CSLREA domain-containing protein
VAVGEAGRRSVAGLLAAALIALACAAALPALAAAESFEVNSTGDQTDAALGDEVCMTGGGACTLRAAIEESNSAEGEDTIVFDKEGLFNGQVGGTISIGTGLPPIVHPVTINGECVIVNPQPCVGVDGPGMSEPALVVENTEAAIEGLAITGAKTGIEVVGGPRFKALLDWLGVKLDGSARGNETGMLLGPGLEAGRIGNEGETNVFANNQEDGLDIHGANNVKVMSGYFGVGPDGNTPAPNGGKDIEVASIGGGSELSPASGNRIGTQLTPEAATTPACDGGCNVISGSGTTGIDLQGNGGEEEPAESTTIVGNYIGLDATGTEAVPNSGDDIHVGRADRTVIGGPRTSEANRFAGGLAAVDAGPEAENLVVRGNSIGVGSTGADLAAPDDGVVVKSEGLPSVAAEAAISGNELRMQGGIGIEQTGLGGWIAGNLITGADTGIRAAGETEEHGNLIEGNLIEGSSANGILLESGFNEVLGNEVLGSGGAGVRIAGAAVSPQFGVNGNLIGGNAEADENLIADSSGAAIEISNPEEAANEVGRNWGFANDGLFIDLVLVPFTTDKKEGTNKGIKPPKFSIAKAAGASGSAEPQARIRVFRKARAEAGEIESFLGEAIADEDGAWEVVYGEPIPAGTRVAATQTGAGGGTSELALATVPAEPGGGGGAQACPLADGCGGPPAATPPTPQTKISAGPKAKSHSTTAKFEFSSSVGGSTFQCKLDKGKFKKCKSPKQYKQLKPGKHVFEVRAVNSVGEADSTPATRKFTVLG